MSIDRRWVLPSVALVAFVVGLSVANSAIAWLPKAGDAATWFGAAGAFLAFGATVWIATDQARQKDLEARNLAVLAAARLNPILMNYLAIWGEMDAAFKSAVANKQIGVFDSYLGRIMAVSTWTRADTLPLTYLPNNVAYYLEHVQTVQPFQIDNFNLSLHRACKRDPVTDKSEYDWYKIELAVMTFLAVAKESAAGVQIALNECSRIIPRSPLLRCVRNPAL